MSSQPPEIVIVGVPRSGTGILQNLLRLSPSIAWVTPATNAMTGFTAKHGLPLAWGFQAAKLLDPVTRALPKRARPRFLEGPSDGSLDDDPLVVADEGSRIWRWHVPERDHDRLVAGDVTPEAEHFYRSVAELHRRHFQVPTFLSKRPANTLRLPFLDAIFPRARFVNLLRDPRAVGASIRASIATGVGGWMGSHPPGWRDHLDRPVGQRVGWQVRAIAETLYADARELELGDRFVEVRYADLTERSEETLTQLYDALGLDRAELESPRGFLDQLENRNDGWRQRLSEEEAEHLLAEVDDLPDALVRPEGAIRVTPGEG